MERLRARRHPGRVVLLRPGRTELSAGSASPRRSRYCSVGQRQRPRARQAVVSWPFRSERARSDNRFRSEERKRGRHRIATNAADRLACSGGVRYLSDAPADHIGAGSVAVPARGEMQGSSGFARRPLGGSKRGCRGVWHDGFAVLADGQERGSRSRSATASGHDHGWGLTATRWAWVLSACDDGRSV
jgi:hypothetical protein